MMTMMTMTMITIIDIIQFAIVFACVVHRLQRLEAKEEILLKGHSEKMSLQNRILDLERRLSDMSDKTTMIAAESNYKVTNQHNHSHPHRYLNDPRLCEHTPHTGRHPCEGEREQPRFAGEDVSEDKAAEPDTD